MTLRIEDVRQAREWGMNAHQLWKAQIRINDAVAADQWDIAWDDGEIEQSAPLVQNVYKGALEDKIASAGASVPSIYVPPPPGTREDRAERESQKRKRVYQSYWDRSQLPKLLKSIYMDWFHTGAAFLMPWTEWFDADGIARPSAERAPFFMKMDPRQAYPLAHNSKREIVQVLFTRQRRIAALKAEYGENNPAFAEFVKYRALRGLDDAEFLEEIWYFDTRWWGVAFGDSLLPREHQGRSIVPQSQIDSIGGTNMVWVGEPKEHKMGRCPVTEAKRLTHDDAYRGALEDIIPALRTAQDFMARLLDDMGQNIYAPVVLDNIENEEEYGPGAILRGTGDGKADIIRDRPPVNFEAQRTVAEVIGQAHRQASWPVQRSGDADASVVSAKGVVALAGTFNSELAWAQQDVEDLLRDTNARAAAFDEHHCAGQKRIYGMDGVTSYTEKYDPAKLFSGDYRNKVSYGDRTGLDESNRITRLAMLRNLEAISLRSFMQKSGATEDALQEERDITIEKLTKIFTDMVLPQRIEAGDLTSLKAFVDRIDDDRETVRSAVLDTIKELEPMPGEIPGMPGGAGGGQGDPIQMMRSLASGGIPGNAEGLPAPPGIGPKLQEMLPPRQRRTVSETAPGGTAA